MRLLPVLALLLLGTHPGTVRAAVAPEVVGTATSLAVLADPTGDHAAWRSGPAEVTVRTDGGAIRPLPVPEDCELAHAGADDLVVRCVSLPRLRLLSPTDGTLTPVTVTPPAGLGSNGYAVLGVGRRWLHLLSQEAIVPVELLADRRTGRTIDLRNDPFGARRVIDLDRASGSARLCRDLRRPLRDPFKAGARYVDATVVNRRALIGDRLHDCRRGVRARRVEPTAFFGPQAFVTTEAFVPAPETVVTRLASGRRIVVPGTVAAVSRRSLWGLDAAGTVTRRPLPTRAR